MKVIRIIMKIKHNVKDITLPDFIPYYYAFKTLFRDELQGFTKLPKGFRSQGIQKLSTVQSAAFKGSLQCGEHRIMYIRQWGITHGKVSLPERKI